MELVSIHRTIDPSRKRITVIVETPEEERELINQCYASLHETLVQSFNAVQETTEKKRTPPPTKERCIAHTATNQQCKFNRRPGEVTCGHHKNMIELPSELPPDYLEKLRANDKFTHADDWTAEPEDEKNDEPDWEEPSGHKETPTNRTCGHKDPDRLCNTCYPEYNPNEPIPREGNGKPYKRVKTQSYSPGGTQ